jgi:hypothetical protein
VTFSKVAHRTADLQSGGKHFIGRKLRNLNFPSQAKTLYLR